MSLCDTSNQSFRRTRWLAVATGVSGAVMPSFTETIVPTSRLAPWTYSVVRTPFGSNVAPAIVTASMRGGGYARVAGPGGCGTLMGPGADGTVNVIGFDWAAPFRTTTVWAPAATPCGTENMYAPRNPPGRTF